MARLIKKTTVAIKIYLGQDSQKMTLIYRFLKFTGGYSQEYYLKVGDETMLGWRTTWTMLQLWYRPLLIPWGVNKSHGLQMVSSWSKD